MKIYLIAISLLVLSLSGCEQDKRNGLIESRKMQENFDKITLPAGFHIREPLPRKSWQNSKATVTYTLTGDESAYHSMQMALEQSGWAFKRNSTSGDKGSVYCRNDHVASLIFIRPDTYHITFDWANGVTCKYLE